MTNGTPLWTGGAASVIAVICCFTPALVPLFGAVGLSAWRGWIGHMSLSALALTLALVLVLVAMAYWLWRRRRASVCRAATSDHDEEIAHG